MKPASLFKQSFFTVTIIVFSHLLASCFANKPMLSSKPDHPIDKSEIAALVTPGKSYKIKLKKEGRDVIVRANRIDHENIFGIVTLFKVGGDTNRKAWRILDGVIRLDNITAIERKGFSPGNTALFCGGMILVAGGTVFLAVQQLSQIWLSP